MLKYKLLSFLRFEREGIFCVLCDRRIAYSPLLSDETHDLIDAHREVCNPDTSPDRARNFYQDFMEKPVSKFRR